MSRELLYLDLALENMARAAAERGAGKAAGAAAAPLVGPLLQVGAPMCTQMNFTSDTAAPFHSLDSPYCTSTTWEQFCYHLCNQSFASSV